VLRVHGCCGPGMNVLLFRHLPSPGKNPTNTNNYYSQIVVQRNINPTDRYTVVESI
jgi:hypothetical protein